MKKFARVFDVGQYQLLVYIEPDNDNEDDGYSRVHQITDVGGAILDMAFVAPDAPAQIVFNDYSQDNAVNFFGIGMVAKVIEQFSEEAA